MLANLTMVRGDTFEFDASVTLNGSALDLTGAGVKFTAKYNLTDADPGVLQVATGQGAVPLSGITVATPANGVAHVCLAPNKTSALASHTLLLFYDLQVTLADGSIRTVSTGQLKIIPDVTTV